MIKLVLFLVHEWLIALFIIGNHRPTASVYENRADGKTVLKKC
jgi:hypothetical protein